MFGFSVLAPLFRCLLSVSYVKSSVKGVPFHNIWTPTHESSQRGIYSTSNGTQRSKEEEANAAEGHITIGRHGIHWERWEARDRGREGGDTKLMENNMLIPTTELETSFLPTPPFLLLLLSLLLQTLMDVTLPFIIFSFCYSIFLSCCSFMWCNNVFLLDVLKHIHPFTVQASQHIKHTAILWDQMDEGVVTMMR